MGVSSNTNSFGLYGVLLLSKDRKVTEIGMSQYQLELKKIEAGAYVNVPLDDDHECDWAAFGAEIPEAKPEMPKHLMSKFWKD